MKKVSGKIGSAGTEEAQREGEGAPPKGKARAVAYIRVSTEDQTLGPEAQRTKILEWAVAQGVAVVGWFEDLGISGSAPVEERPGLCGAIDALIVHRAAHLIVAKRDRLARDAFVGAMAERYVARTGANVQSADGLGNGDDPESLLMRALFGAFAEYERGLIRWRTRSALAVKKARGERVGGVPFGQRVGPTGVLEDHPEELRARARMLELREQGTPIRAIAETLTAEGFTPRGEAWHATSIRRILAS